MSLVHHDVDSTGSSGANHPRKYLPPHLRNQPAAAADNVQDSDRNNKNYDRGSNNDRSNRGGGAGGYRGNSNYSSSRLGDNAGRGGSRSFNNDNRDSNRDNRNYRDNRDDNRGSRDNRDNSGSSSAYNESKENTGSTAAEPNQSSNSPQQSSQQQPSQSGGGLISLAPQEDLNNPPREENGRFGGRDIRSGNYSSADVRGNYAGGSDRNTRFSRDSFNSRRTGPTMQRDMRLEAELYGEVKKGIEFKNYEDIPVETSGLEVPQSVEKFQDLDVHEVLSSNIELSGYEHPTPIQKHAIPIGIAGRDIMACAQTGSGKTMAFLLPMIASILKHELHLRPPPAQAQQQQAQGGNSFRRNQRSYPCALVLAPVRELATQIFNEARKVVYRTGIKPVVVYGGQDIRNQLRDIERGCDILVATPGRLVDLLERGRVSMANIEFLVFDEADRMLDMGFEPQIRQIVEGSDMPEQTRQTLMFSATFPKEIQRLAQDFLKNYVFLAVGRVGSTTDFITQKVEYSGGSDSDKLDRLMQILSTCEGLTLIFVETKRGADMLENELMKEGITATSIHGDRSQQERESALQMFKIGRAPVLVATDVASRGLDIPDVRCVINYDLPTNIDDYVHRIGRTGRAGNKGTAIAFISDKNKPILKDLWDLMKENSQELPPWFDSLVHSSGGSGGGYGGYNRGYNRGGGRGGGGGGDGGGNRSFGPSRDFRSDMQGSTQRYNAASSSSSHSNNRTNQSNSNHRGGGGGGGGGYQRNQNSTNDSW
jgi:ATP-dependent RNA helicase DDX3X